ncbi:hypothetical protein [Anatilimnocola floriformis]|uniref:hypothetical protein n=1 Tax=Anatilimnocola floriformis TaxID=2948575 RepID=UPI0020C4AA00|nr:hypothetical protein [Anatilimnocola floriformis]
MFTKLRFTIRDILWGMTLLAVLLGWAVDRNWRARISSNEDLRAWQFASVAHFLKQKTPWTATTSANGDVVFTSSDHEKTEISQQAFVRPEHVPQPQYVGKPIYPHP